MIYQGNYNEVLEKKKRYSSKHFHLIHNTFPLSVKLDKIVLNDALKILHSCSQI